jgi:hypothetical protein
MEHLRQRLDINAHRDCTTAHMLPLKVRYRMAVHPRQLDPIKSESESEAAPPALRDPRSSQSVWVGNASKSITIAIPLQAALGVECIEILPVMIPGSNLTSSTPPPG